MGSGQGNVKKDHAAAGEQDRVYEQEGLNSIYWGWGGRDPIHFVVN
jgi:hypothetical protein